MIDLKDIAASFAKEYCSDAIYPSHLFKAVLHKEAGLVKFIETTLGKDYYYLQEWADIQMQLSPKAVKPVSSPEYSSEAEEVMDEAQSYMEKFGLDECTPVCVLASLVTPGVGFTFDQLKTMPLTAAEICDAVGHSTNTGGSPAANASVRSQTVRGGGAVASYCIDLLNEEVTDSPVIGFESELQTIFEVLGRKSKSNLLITGESGVGKTALVRAFVQRVKAGHTPDFLKNSSVYELDLAALGADASYKGETDDRFKNVLEGVCSKAETVLVIESVDKIFDKTGSFSGCATILKQALSKGGFLLLCTSSIDGYTKNIETDMEFVTKLEKITVEAPDDSLCLRILEGAAGVYADYHHLGISSAVLSDAIRLAKRYLTEKSLPDSAFDLIDRTMSMVRNTNDMAADDIAELSAELEAMDESDEAAAMTSLEWLNHEVFSRISCILTAKLDADVDFSKLSTVQERVDYLKDTLARLSSLSAYKKDAVDSADLYAVVARQTGIPLGKVQSKERDRLSNGEATLKKRVVGQDHAVRKVLDAVFESRSGLSKKGQPMGSFFFLGPTGTGKTELSKALAEFLFEDESALLRFDMSEFKEEHSVALLYGAPPGYVGYEEGGLLVNKIRQKPYSVVLFDEIEKAHKSVFDLFLQILDEGKLHDRLGRVGDFSNALILFTSNIGSQFIVDSFNKGEIPTNNDLMDIMQDYFRPEFLARLTEIVPFSPITEETVTKIFDIHLKGLLKLLDEQDIKLEMDDEARKSIALMGFNQQYGARPVLGIIRKELRNPLSRLIISGKIKAGDTVKVTMKDGHADFSTGK